MALPIQRELRVEGRVAITGAIKVGAESDKLGLILGSKVGGNGHGP